MAEVTNALIYEVLKRIQVDVGDLKSDGREIKARIGALEVAIANLSVRMDRRDEIMDRILT